MTQIAHNSPESSHPGRLLGYARVSTTSQNLDVQLRALTEAGVPAELVFTDKISGTQAERPGLAALMAQAREGDTLMQNWLARLGRSLVRMVTTIDELIRRGVALRSLTDTIDTTTPTGHFQLNVFVAMAEYQRALIVERVQDGLEAARPAGCSWAGSPRSPPSRSAPSTGCTGRAVPRQDPPPRGSVQRRSGSGAAWRD